MNYPIAEIVQTGTVYSAFILPMGHCSTEKVAESESQKELMTILSERYPNVAVLDSASFVAEVERRCPLLNKGE